MLKLLIQMLVLVIDEMFEIEVIPVLYSLRSQVRIEGHSDWRSTLQIFIG
jgi:hypothetical protein